MANRHDIGAPAFLAPLQELMESYGWRIRWSAGSGPSYTMFDCPGYPDQRNSLQYWWRNSERDRSRSIGLLRSGIMTPTYIGENLDEVKKFLRTFLPKFVKFVSPYCDWGQLTGEEMQDEFGIVCSKPGTHKSTFANNGSLYFCDEHTKTYKLKFSPKV